MFGFGSNIGIIIFLHDLFRFIFEPSKENFEHLMATFVLVFVPNAIKLLIFIVVVFVYKVDFLPYLQDFINEYEYIHNLGLFVEIPHSDLLISEPTEVFQQVTEKGSLEIKDVNESHPKGKIKGVLMFTCMSGMLFFPPLGLVAIAVAAVP